MTNRKEQLQAEIKTLEFALKEKQIELDTMDMSKAEKGLYFNGFIRQFNDDPTRYYSEELNKEIQLTFDMSNVALSDFDPKDDTEVNMYFPTEALINYCKVLEENGVLNDDND